MTNEINHQEYVKYLVDYAGVDDTAESLGLDVRTVVRVYRGGKPNKNTRRKIEVAAREEENDRQWDEY